MAIDSIIKNADDLTEVIARMDKSQRDLFYRMMVETRSLPNWHVLEASTASSGAGKKPRGVL